MHQLPHPPGPYCVGYVDGHYFRKETARERYVGYRCYYPTEHPIGEPVNYLSEAQLDMFGALDFYKILQRISGKLPALQTNAYHKAPAAACAPRGILLYSHGYTGYAWMNSIQHEALASAGYIVFALSHPGESIFHQVKDHLDGVDMAFFEAFGRDSGDYMKKIGKADINTWTDEEVMIHLQNVPHIVRSLKNWSDDLRGMCEQLEILHRDSDILAGKLGSERVGIYGYSFGGAAAFQTALEDSRIKAAVNIDGWQYGGAMLRNTLSIPAMAVTKSCLHLDANFGIHNDVARVWFPGSTHIQFSDFGTICAKDIREFDPHITVEGSAISHALTDLLLAFFSRGFSESHTPDLTDIAAQYPELVTIL